MASTWIRETSWTRSTAHSTSPWGSSDRRRRAQRASRLPTQDDNEAPLMNRSLRICALLALTSTLSLTGCGDDSATTSNAASTSGGGGAGGQGGHGGAGGSTGSGGEAGEGG